MTKEQQKRTTPQCDGFDEYEIEAWLERLQSYPVKLIEQLDTGGAYEMERFSIVKLENGKYATIYESGCSCYGPEDADIDLHPTLASAKQALKAYKKERAE